MYLMYVDESGDTGMAGSPTEHFVLTGLVLHESIWTDTLEQLIAFRHRLRDAHELRLREELHASQLLTRPGELVRIRKHDRLAMIRAFADRLSTMAGIRVICVHVDKRNKAHTYDVFEAAWTALIQRFVTGIIRGDFPNPGFDAECGMIFPDDTDQLKLKRLAARLQAARMIEQPSFRDSAESHFVQAADLCAFLLYQSIAPSAYMRAKGGRAYFERLQPLLVRQMSSTNRRGTIRL